MKLDINALITAKILNGGGGGGAGITKIAEKEFEVSTTSTSDIDVGTVDCGATAWNPHKLIVISVADKAGARTDHFVGGWYIVQQDQMFDDSAPNTISFSGYILRKSSASYVGTGGTSYGIKPTKLTKSGTLTMKARYNSSNTLTIDGTYVVSVYLVDIDPFPGA